jgi:geranylgeranyl reductase family protein
MILPPAAAADVPDGTWDVVVVGAGPAGSTAAAHMARSGLDVLLVDRERFPRDKVCGDGLIADTIGALDRLGALAAVSAQARRLSATAIFSPSRHRLDVAGEFLTLKREQLDAIIAAQACADGARMITGNVTRIEPGANRVKVWLEGRAAPLSTQFAVIATGADVRLARRAGAERDVVPSAVAVRCYIRSTARIDELVISYDREILPGYAWIFPMAGDEYNVGCGVFYRDGARGDVNLRRMFDKFLCTFPDARRLLAGEIGRTPLKGAPLRCGLNGAGAARLPRVLSIGESIGTTFPFTGEGIGKAMETGELAAETMRLAVESGDPGALDRFDALVSGRLAPKYAGYRAAERWLARPWVADFLARRARRSSFLRDALAGILNETIDPASVFSFAGIAKALLR